MAPPNLLLGNASLAISDLSQLTDKVSTMDNPFPSRDILELPSFCDRPHVFILGAGASKAAFLNGDKNGFKLPVLKDFVDILNLESLLKSVGIDPPYDDFENIFATLVGNVTTLDVAKKIEQGIFSYFSKMQLPDCPTIYDHLVLSLRDKDAIATFNWDPLLPQAIERNYDRLRERVPNVYFLHGNVYMGFCTTCKIQAPIRYSVCPQCGRVLENMPLMYPIGEKDYSQHMCIKANWDNLKHDLSIAYLVTVFGYSAPKTDVEAIDLLSRGWGDSDERMLEQFEFIVRPGTIEDVSLKWDQFVHTHHYDQPVDSFYKSRAGTFPRRSCEVTFAQFQLNTWLDPDSTILENLSTFESLDDFFIPLIEKENQKT